MAKKSRILAQPQPEATLEQQLNAEKQARVQKFTKELQQLMDLYGVQMVPVINLIGTQIQAGVQVIAK